MNMTQHEGCVESVTSTKDKVNLQYISVYKWVQSSPYKSIL